MSAADVTDAGGVARVARRIRVRPGGRAAGIAILVCLALFALAGPLATGHDPLAQNLDRVLSRPDAVHWLGTDQLGRDLCTRLAHAVRLSFALALACVAVAACVGAGLGMLAAWRGGLVDRVLVAVADAFLALPTLVLVLLVGVFAPGELLPLAAGIVLATWVEYFRLVRAMTGTIVVSPHVEAARLLGFGPLHVVRRHLLPELAPVLVTLGTFGAATAVLTLAALGFVGVGLAPPAPELGLMMIELLPHHEEAPHALAMPVITLVVFLAGLVLAAGDRAGTEAGG